ncbi:MAG: RT0821/Lpp0805 family surface protein [Alphaproteobacteria bacterium]|nr:RT0821/Lpp0805 family surface protein [Alphaproteobacteria bacterium]
MFRKIAVIAVVATGLAACESSGGQKQTGGAILGGIGGAVVGSQFGGGTGKLAAVAAGTLIGALIGSEIGSSLDKADKLAMAQSTQDALETRPTGSSATWQNPDSGNYGTVTPERTYNKPNGTPCREFTQTVYIGGKAEQAYGTACRQQDGSWKIES